MGGSIPPLAVRPIGGIGIHMGFKFPRLSGLRVRISHGALDFVTELADVK